VRSLVQAWGVMKRIGRPHACAVPAAAAPPAHAFCSQPRTPSSYLSSFHLPPSSFRPSRNPVAFFGLAGVAYISIPRILNSRHADDMPTLARDWKREEAKRFLNYEREGAPGAPVVLNPISKGM
jgi:hypothetical protein